ncbi:molybdenum cofactor guanylyltransferase [Microbulbifer magnicolonia]|uniref:molybdenum cofactor guanylyltransferase n=1 Tax=Microbulbifer magnicolonia TaxID=3109744 RepID=UPI002B4038F7|nr:molybdenum cofactor guanylyltransferase [Microbulbifer sp. GG15]
MRVCPVILAGGRSRRMGKDKALLKLPGGQTLLQRAHALLNELDAPPGVQMLPPLVSGDRPGGIADRVCGRGPLGGLHAVAEHLAAEGVDCDALLVIPVDMPLLQREILRQLCAAGAGGAASALCFGACYLPLWLRLDPRSRRYLQEFMAGGEGGAVRSLLQALGGRQLQAPDGDWHTNVNRPPEFQAVCAAARQLQLEKT